MPPQPQENAWHLDRKVPIAIIAALVMQSLALGWFASSLNERLNAVESYVIEAKRVGTSDRLVRLETLMGEIQRTLHNIDRKLDGRSYRTLPPGGP